MPKKNFDLISWLDDKKLDPDNVSDLDLIIMEIFKQEIIKQTGSEDYSLLKKAIQENKVATRHWTGKSVNVINNVLNKLFSVLTGDKLRKNKDSKLYLSKGKLSTDKQIEILEENGFEVEVNYTIKLKDSDAT